MEPWKGLPATIIIAESFTRIMGPTAGNVYSTIVAVVSCSITVWILVGGWISYGWGGKPPLAPALIESVQKRFTTKLPGLKMCHTAKIALVHIDSLDFCRRRNDLATIHETVHAYCFDDTARVYEFRANLCTGGVEFKNIEIPLQ